MYLSSIKKKVKKLPDSPGVYFFHEFKPKTPQLGHRMSKLRGKMFDGRILYIGKATSLRDRVKSYFSKDLSETRGPLIVQMVEKAKSISFKKTDSVLEALILEANLIKEFKPYYNTQAKDDKSYNHIVITEEDYPRVLLVREKELKAESWKLKAFFGPFPQGGILKEALKIIRKIFPYRDKCVPIQTNISNPRSHLVLQGETLNNLNKSGKPCFNAQIALCPGVCSGSIGAEGYQKQIKNLILFFEGKKKKIIFNLQKEMKQCVRAQEFEKANEVKKRLFALEHIQDIALIKRKNDYEYEPQLGHRMSKLGGFRIEGYDVAHLGGKEMVGVMTVIENRLPKKNDYRKFKIKSLRGVNDPAALREIISRRLKHHEWPMPDLIVVDGNEVQKKAVESILKKQKLNAEVMAVVKDKRHKPRAIIGKKEMIEKQKNSIFLANSEAHRFAITFHKLLRQKSFLEK